MILIAFGIPGPSGGAGPAGPAGPSGTGNVAVVTQTADTSVTGTANYGQMGALTTGISVSANSRLRIDFFAAYSNSSGGASTGFRIVLDGVPLTHGEVRQTSWGTVDPEGVAINVTTGALSAGAHTVAVEWSPLSASVTIACNANQAASGHQAWLNVTELKA